MISTSLPWIAVTGCRVRWIDVVVVCEIVVFVFFPIFFRRDAFPA